MDKRLYSWSSCFQILVTLAAFLAAATRCHSATCTSTTVDALLEFRNAFNDPRNRVFYNWDDDRESDCCNWPGITCQNGALVGLDLEGPSGSDSDRVTYNRSYSGRPGHTLDRLQDLQTLKLKHLQFSSRIPSEWNSFSDRLEEILVNNCDLRDSIPSDIASNSNLQTLDLRSNYLTGEIPSRLCELQDLTYLDLSYNNLDTDSIPSCITNGGTITNVNYGHQSANHQSDFDDDRNHSGSMVVPSKLLVMMMILLLPLFVFAA